MKQQLLFPDDPIFGRRISCGARELFKLILSYARGPKGAIPFQMTLAGKLRATIRTVQRWLSELKSAGMVLVKKRQRTSAIYFPQVAGLPVENVLSKEGPISITSEKVLLEKKPAARSQVVHQRKPEAPPAGWTNELAEVFRRDAKFFPPVEIVSALYQAGAASGNSAAGMALFWMERGCDIGTRSRNARNPMLYACGAIRREFGVAA